MSAKETPVAICRNSAGQFAAVSNKAPYFFFVADSEQEVIDIATQALNFYFKTEGQIEIKRPERIEPRISQFFRKKIENIHISNLAPA